MHTNLFLLLQQSVVLSDKSMTSPGNSNVTFYNSDSQTGHKCHTNPEKKDTFVIWFLAKTQELWNVNNCNPNLLSWKLANWGTFTQFVGFSMSFSSPFGRTRTGQTDGWVRRVMWPIRMARQQYISYMVTVASNNSIYRRSHLLLYHHGIGCIATASWTQLLW